MGKFREQSGFTIVELALSLVIISVVIGMSASAGIMRIAAQKHKITTEHMEYVQNAIISYAHAYEHLPCPANPALNPSNANAGIGGGTNAPNISGGLYTGGNCTSVTCSSSGSTGRCYGSIPYVTLGIPEYTTLDGWGNKIAYGVSEALTYSGSDWPSLTPSQSRTTAGYRNDGNPDIYDWGLPSTSSDISSRGAISIRDNWTSPNFTLSNIAFALVSHGPNGLGGYRADGSQNGVFTSDENEADNFDDYASGIDTLIIKYPYSTYDDITYHKTKWQIEAMK